VAAAGANQGVLLVSVWQDEGQITAAYGPQRARTVLSNHTARMYLPGVADEQTLRALSAAIGEHRVRRVTEGRDAAGRRTRSVTPHDEPVAPVEWLRRLPAGEAIVLSGRHKPMLRRPSWRPGSTGCAPRMPAHWPDDPMAVAELAALRTAWHAAYANPRPTFEPVHFHDALARVLDRVSGRLARAEACPADIELAAWVAWLRESYQLAAQIPSDWTVAGPGFEPVRFHEARRSAVARVAEWQAARIRR